MWKAMTDAEKAPWEQKSKDAMAAFNAYKNSEDYVAPEKKEKRADSDKPEKDPDAPKRPVGGAYGIFSNERREQITQELQARGEKGFGPVAKMTSEAFKALKEDERRVYEERFKEAQDRYKQELAAYEKKKAEKGPACDDKPTSPPKPSPRKRGGIDNDKAALPSKRAKVSVKSAPEPHINIDPSTLAAAERAGMATMLENLARRPEIVAKAFDG